MRGVLRDRQATVDTLLELKRGEPEKRDDISALSRKSSKTASLQLICDKLANV